MYTYICVHIYINIHVHVAEDGLTGSLNNNSREIDAEDGWQRERVQLLQRWQPKTNIYSVHKNIT